MDNFRILFWKCIYLKKKIKQNFCKNLHIEVFATFFLRMFTNNFKVKVVPIDVPDHHPNFLIDLLKNIK